MMADDWPCERRTPVSAIVWNGSYIGYQYRPCEGQIPVPPVKPTYFLISVYRDVPDNLTNLFSHPGQKIWEHKAYDYDEVLVGYDKHPETVPAVGYEPVFRYSVRMTEDEWFCQHAVNGIYWISIVAVYVDTDPDYVWGWTNHRYTYMDNAVAGRPLGAGDEWEWIEQFDQTGQPEDLSFILFTEPDECCICVDYDDNGIVNWPDFLTFAGQWLWAGPPGGYNLGDLNCDGVVNWPDFLIFAGQWLQSCP